MTIARICSTVTALCLVAAFAACDDSSPVAQNQTSTISGSVLYSETGDPAAGVSVDLERCERGMGMTDETWHHSDHATTDSHGRFHLEYVHQSMHRYRLKVRGTTDPRGMCYLDGTGGQSIVLRVP